MSIFSKKNKSILVSPSNTYGIWNVPVSDIAVNTEVIIDTGCLVSYAVNGQFRNTYEAGNKIVINEKWEHKSITKLALVAANSEKVFEICCGVGGVPFNDRELETDTVVGTNADMKLRIKDPWKLYTMMGNRDIAESEINDFLRAKLAEILKTELAKQLQFNTYFTLTVQTGKMSETVAELIKRNVLDSYGLSMVSNSFALNNFIFQDDYLELRKRAGNSRAENNIVEEEVKAIRKRTRAELEAISAIGEASKPQAEQTGTKCPKCGVEVKKGTNFCPACGAKIK